MHLLLCTVGIVPKFSHICRFFIRLSTYIFASISGISEWYQPYDKLYDDILWCNWLHCVPGLIAVTVYKIWYLCSRGNYFRFHHYIIRNSLYAMISLSTMILWFKAMRTYCIIAFTLFWIFVKDLLNVCVGGIFLYVISDAVLFQTEKAQSWGFWAVDYLSCIVFR